MWLMEVAFVSQKECSYRPGGVTLQRVRYYRLRVKYGWTKTWGLRKWRLQVTDAASYGDLYQWGRNTDGHESRTSATTAGPVAAGAEGANFVTIAPPMIG